MHPHNVWLGVLIAGLCLASGPSGAWADDDLAQLRGEWQEVRIILRGDMTVVDKDDAVCFKIFPKMGKIKYFAAMSGEAEGEFKIDATTDPKTMVVSWDPSSSDGPDQKHIERFIYKFDGDELWMASRGYDNPFPRSFTGKAVTTFILRKR